MHARKLPRISEPSFDRDYGNGATASTSKVTKNYRDRRSVSPSERGTNKLLKKLEIIPGFFFRLISLWLINPEENWIQGQRHLKCVN